MKKLLLLLAIITSFGIYNHSTAQCVISDLKIRPTDINSGSCEVSFDFTWTQDVNIGNKYAYIHIWTESGYHTPAANWVDKYSNTGAYPKAADLVYALSTIVIDKNSSDTPLIGTVYHPDLSYILPQQTGLSVTKVHLNNTLIERLTVQNIHITLPACTGAQTLMFDIWASQAANGKNVHCVTQGGKLIINEIRANGLLYCFTPRQFQAIIQNIGPALNNVTYKVYLDYPPLNIINPQDTLVYSSDSIDFPADYTYVSPILDYLPYSASKVSASKPLIMEVTIPGRPNTTIASIFNGCAPLPVKFISFTAMQENDKVMLNWQTGNELNNKGFEVQRKFTSGNYQTIAFIPSQALNGNSGLSLNYSYHDMDKLDGKGQVYYRIKQVDIDGNSNYSEVRAIKNNAVKIDLLIYPNPGNGMTNITIPDGIGLIDISLNDIAGKEIKRWNSVNMRHVQLHNLHSGIYTLRVRIQETGDILVNKIVIQ